MIAIMMIRSKLTRTPINMYRFDVEPARTKQLLKDHFLLLLVNKGQCLRDLFWKRCFTLLKSKAEEMLLKINDEKIIKIPLLN